MTDDTTISQSHFRIQTRSQRHSEGPRPRRLTKVLRGSSTVISLTVPREHTRLIESRRSSSWRLVCVRTRWLTSSWPSLCLLYEWIQPSIDQIYWHVETEQTGGRPWGITTSVQTRVWRTFWSRHGYQMTFHCQQICLGKLKSIVPKKQLSCYVFLFIVGMGYQ